ncbi:hypothetical protein TRIP_D310200 [uncultured Paludibacter sp.]|nr:hypothetical protein TRIP_D310200 [uncultured Paludibacter sp.]
MENKINYNENELLDMVKNEISKLPTGVLVGATLGSLLVLSRVKSPMVKSIVNVAVPIVIAEILNKLLTKTESREPVRVVEEVEAKVVK